LSIRQNGKYDKREKEEGRKLTIINEQLAIKSEDAAQTSLRLNCVELGKKA
jgi:hypothetical protein